MKTMTDEDEKDPSVIPEDIKEFIREAHKERNESRPDEGWRITPAAKPGAVDAPYKRDDDMPEKSEDSDVLGQLKSLGMNYDDGGATPGSDFSVDGGDSDTFKTNGVMPPPSVVPPPAPVIAPKVAPVDTAPVQNAAPPDSAPVDVPKPAAAAPAAADPTDQSYMDRANKVLGLGPDQQASFIKLLNDRAQRGQIGAGIAGIGDAIASGGTLGKVNPNNMGRAEDLIQNKEKQGIDNMQLIRGNQEKAAEMSDKLEARDPKSPLSKFAQKAYGSVGKKIGIDLSNAPASLIADVTGKGVDALNTEYQNQLKMAGLNLQSKQIDATIGNQTAERAHAKEQERAEATKTLADQGLLKKATNFITPSGRAAQSELEREASGGATPASSGPVKVDSKAAYEALPSGTHYVDSYGTEKVKK